MQCISGPRSPPCLEQRQPQQKQQQQLPQKRDRCFRWLQPCAPQTSVGCRSGERKTRTCKGTGRQKEIMLTISLELDSPEETQTSQAPTVRRRQRRRGFRVYYRPVAASGNYYSLPYPPPEQLKMDCDGDAQVWQDLEVRVISHEGLVVWPDLQTLSDKDVTASNRKPAPPQIRKFGGGASHRQSRRPQPSALAKYGPPQPQQPPSKPSGSAEFSQVDTLLTIEATIHHRPNVPEVSHSALVPSYRLVDVDASTQSYATDCCNYNGDRRPMNLLRRLRLMQVKQQMQQALYIQQVTQLRQERQSQKQDQNQERPTLDPGQQLRRGTGQRSRIPRLLPNWSLRQQPTPQPPQRARQLQLGGSRCARKQNLRLQFTELKDSQQLLQQREAATTISTDQVGGKRRGLPNYMRPYSPVLLYPVPSKLPVTVRIKRRAAFSANGRSDASESFGARL